MNHRICISLYVFGLAQLLSGTNIADPEVAATKTLTPDPLGSSETEAAATTIQTPDSVNSLEDEIAAIGSPEAEAEAEAVAEAESEQTSSEELENTNDFNDIKENDGDTDDFSPTIYEAYKDPVPSNTPRKCDSATNAHHNAISASISLFNCEKQDDWLPNENINKLQDGFEFAPTKIRNIWSDFLDIVNEYIGQHNYITSNATIAINYVSDSIVSDTRIVDEVYNALDFLSADVQKLQEVCAYIDQSQQISDQYIIEIRSCTKILKTHLLPSLAIIKRKLFDFVSVYCSDKKMNDEATEKSMVEVHELGEYITSATNHIKDNFVTEGDVYEKCMKNASYVAEDKFNECWTNLRQLLPMK